MVLENDERSTIQKVIELFDSPFGGERFLFGDQFCSIGENVFEATATIFFLPPEVSCIKMAPQARSEASVVRLKGRLKSGTEMIGLEASFFLIFKKAFSAS